MYVKNVQNVQIVKKNAHRFSNTMVQCECTPHTIMLHVSSTVDNTDEKTHSIKPFPHKTPLPKYIRNLLNNWIIFGGNHFVRPE